MALKAEDYIGQEMRERWKEAGHRFNKAKLHKNAADAAAAMWRQGHPSQ